MREGYHFAAVPLNFNITFERFLSGKRYQFVKSGMGIMTLEPLRFFLYGALV